MLISAGDDTKLFAYSVQEFTKFSPHDICPAPQRLPFQLVRSVFDQTPLLLVQAPYYLDILSVRTKSGNFPSNASGPSGGLAATGLLARVKSKASRKIICSALSSSGELFAYSDHVKPNLFELKRREDGKSWTVTKKQLPHRLSFVHSMVFSADSNRLIMAGHDRKIYVSFFCLYVLYGTLRVYCCICYLRRKTNYYLFCLTRTSSKHKRFKV